MSDHVVIPPLTFKWAEWVGQYRANRDAVLAAMKTAQMPDKPIVAVQLIGDFQRHIDAWLQSFDEAKRRSVVELLLAESDMLIMLLLDAKAIVRGTMDERERILDGFRFDVRERYYEAIPMVVAIERVGFERAPDVRRAFNELAQLAAEFGWLP